MRILMLSQFYPPIMGGQERHVRDLAHALSARGHVVEVATTATDGAPGTIGDGPVTVHRLSTTTGRFPSLYSDPSRPHTPPVADPRLRRGLDRLLQSGHFDVAHAHDWAVNSLLGPARRAGLPLVFTEHDYSHVCATKRLMRAGAPCPGPKLVACVRCAADKYGPLVGPPVALSNMLARRRRERDLAAFVAVSDSVLRKAGPLPPAHGVVVPNFVPDSLLVDLSSTEAPPGADAPLLFAGDLSPDKGVRVLGEAYGRLSDPPPLLLAGRRFPDSPTTWPAGVEELGPVRPSELALLMRRSLAVVVPSVWPDPCPTVVMEAMAAARPVVASATGGIPDLVDDGVTGILVPPGDARALADALDTVVGDPAGAAGMGRRGLNRVALFTASAVAKRLEDLYSHVVATT
jgi:glycosyltransferase involved in cell wall biosynthesis